jgi:hypothetical protein
MSCGIEEYLAAAAAPLHRAYDGAGRSAWIFYVPARHRRHMSVSVSSVIAALH